MIAFMPISKIKIGIF